VAVGERESSLFKHFWTPACAGVTTVGTFYEFINIDELARSRKMLFLVIPAEAGIQSFHVLLDFYSPNATFGDRLRRE